MTTNQVDRVLTEARRLVQAGWVQHVSSAQPETADGPSRFCAAGAIGRAIRGWSGGRLRLARLARMRMEKTLHKEGYAPSLVAYNDAPGRTQDDVVALFDRAIARSRRRK